MKSQFAPNTVETTCLYSDKTEAATAKHGPLSKGKGHLVYRDGPSASARAEARASDALLDNMHDASGRRVDQHDAIIRIDIAIVGHSGTPVLRYGAQLDVSGERRTIALSFAALLISGAAYAQSTVVTTGTAPTVTIEPQYRTRIHTYVTEHHPAPFSSAAPF
jgi:hypothetical protein